MRPFRLFALVFAILLAVVVRADEAADLRAAKVRLERTRDEWKQESTKYRERLEQKREQLKAVERTPEVREQLANDSMKAAVDTMKDAGKQIPTSVGRNDVKKLEGGARLIKDVLKQIDADKKLDAVDDAMLGGEVDR